MDSLDDPVKCSWVTRELPTQNSDEAILVVVGLYFVLVERSLMISLGASDTFGRFLALGLTVLIGVEATVNMAVVTGILPTKGLALPLISYGGSSLIITLAAVGILLNISSRQVRLDKRS